jgi:hypothetical protein
VAVDGKGFELDAEAETLLVWEGRADFGPTFAGFAVALVVLDGEDVEVGKRGQLGLDRRRSGCRPVGVLLIAIVHLENSFVNVSDFVSPGNPKLWGGNPVA